MEQHGRPVETVGFRRHAELPGIEVRDVENSERRWRCFSTGFEFLAPRTWRGEILHRRRQGTVGPGTVFCTYPSEVFKGRITAIEPSVKYTSGIIPIQAEIPNSDMKLLPGMYASLDVLLPDHGKKIVVPQSAVTFNLYGETAYVIDQKSMTVQPVTVHTGPRRDNIVVIESGLKAGDMVVVAGQLKLSTGTKVNVVEGQTLPEMTQVPVQ